MKDFAVVFDTNAYRDLCRRILPAGSWTLQSIGAAEAQRQITAYANPFVVMELASHLWDEGDPDYSQCRCGLASLEQHCTALGGGTIRIMADSESLVAKMLYDRTPTGHDESTERLCKVARAVAMTAYSSSLDALIARACRQVAYYIEDREKSFVGDMRDLVKGLNPACQDWNPFVDDPAKRQAALSTIRSAEIRRALAAVFVLKAARQIRVAPDEPGLGKKVDTVLEHCSATIALYIEILKRIAETGCNIQKEERPNWIWDMQIALGIGEWIGNPAQQLVLVTADGDIADAAQAASLGDFVLPPDEYLQVLQDSP